MGDAYGLGMLTNLFQSTPVIADERMWAFPSQAVRCAMFQSTPVIADERMHNGQAAIPWFDVSIHARHC